MRLFDPEKTSTRDLIRSVRQSVTAAWAIGVLMGLILAMLMLREDSLSERDSLYGTLLLVGFAVFLAFWYWTLKRKLLPELERRCVDPRPPSSNLDKTVEFKRRQRWRKPGLAVFLLSIPAFFVLAGFGQPPFTDSGLPSSSGWLVIILFVAPGLGLMMAASLCPACANPVGSGAWKSGKCPNCGTRIIGDK